MIPRLRPTLGVSEFSAALAARSSVADFELAFASLADQAHAVAFPYGRTGLMFLLEALRIQDCDIIVPAYTCVVVAHAIVFSGNRPVFIDSEVDGFNMDLDLAEDAIGKQTRVLIATSIHGYPVDLDRLAKIRERHPDLIVIQDCAHSFMAEWNSRPVQKEGVASIFGLNISKHMTSIFGGMVTTDDHALYERLLRLRADRLKPVGWLQDRLQAIYLLAASAALTPLAYGIVRRVQEAGFIDRFVKYFDEHEIDMPENYLVAMGRTASSVGVRQCQRYPTIIERRRRIAEFYVGRLQSTSGIALPPIVGGATYSHFVARVPDPVDLVERAARCGVELGRVIDYSVPDMPAYRQHSNNARSFPQTHRLNAEIVNLPLSVSDAQASFVADVVRQCLEQQQM